MKKRYNQRYSHIFISKACHARLKNFAKFCGRSMRSVAESAFKMYFTKAHEEQIDAETRRCNACNKILPLEHFPEFYSKQQKKTYRRTKCDNCWSAYKRRTK